MAAIKEAPNIPLYATKGDLVQASKAVHDQLKDTLTQEAEGIETNLLIKLGKSLEARQDKRLEDAITKRMEGEYVKRLEHIESNYQQKLLEMKNFYEAQMGFMVDAHSKMMSEFTAFMKSIPTPVVNVTTPEQSPPQVNINLPQQKAADVVVNVPQQPVPNIEVKASEVVVQQAPQRKTVKNISYDEYSRPIHIEEREVE